MKIEFLEFMNRRCDYIADMNSTLASLKSFFLSPHKKALFGKGRQTTVMYEFSRMVGIDIYAVITTSKGEVAEERWIRDIPDYTIADYPDEEDTDVLLSINEKWQGVVEKNLLESGFKNLYKVRDWDSFNYNFRQEYFYYIMQKNNIDVDDDLIRIGDFQIRHWRGQSNEYINSFLPEALDIMYPFCFADTSACIEGPYERDNVCIGNNEIIIDAGANIGMFSACAASRGGNIVYAFEPSKGIEHILKDNASLYGGSIQVVTKALSDSTGEASFVVSNSGENNKNRLAKVTDENTNAHIENVECITLDDFVIENNLKSVDFIKADIEGAERKMLKGARVTLKRFAPKLAICTYHLPDDSEVLEEIILEANPDYHVVHGPYKLYAYVE